MAKGVLLGHETARRMVDRTRRAEDTPVDRTGRGVPANVLPREYREFELTEELLGGVGSTAEVKWLRWSTADEEFVDSGETGEVLDATGNVWGIETERGEARYLGGKWIVHRNPGRPNYRGKLDADLNSGSSAVMSVWEGDPLADTTRNVTVHDWFISSGKKITSGTKISAIHDSGKWYLEVPAACEADQ